MKKKLALTLVFGILGVGVYGQTIKSLGYNTTNGQVVYSGTNTLAFTNETIKFQRVGEPDYITISEGRTIGYFLSENYINLEEMTFSPRISVYDGANSLEISAVAAQTRTNLALGATWLTNTNVTNFRTAVGLGSTDNVILNEVQATSFVVADETNSQISFEGNSASTTRTNLGLGWSALTNTNASNFRNAIDLGTNDSPRFGAVNVIDTIFSFGQTLISGGSISVNNSNSQGVSMNPAGYTAGSINIVSGVGGNTNAITFSAAAAAATRTNLGLGLSVLTNTNNANFLSDLGIGTNSSPSFSNVSVSNLLVTGNFTNLGTIYGFKTNVGPFEGIGNFFASNNTTVSNETLFRVGLAEQNDKSAQFGFRVARTNNGGEGFAVFSVFGYNALMMIGPSDRSRSNSITNTNAGIEADIWSISPTNKVMTLITTNTGAMQMHRPIGFNTNASAPANTTNVVGWIEMYVGTNSVRVPYYQ